MAKKRHQYNASKYHFCTVLSGFFTLLLFLTTAVSQNIQLQSSHQVLDASTAISVAEAKVAAATPVSADSPAISSTFIGNNSTPVQTQIQAQAPVYMAASTPVATEVASVPSSNISIGGRVISIFRSASTMVDAGSQVGLYGEHFLYGHNSAAVFGHLAGLPDGTVFTVTLDGATHTYQIRTRVTLQYTNPSGADYVAKYMNGFVYSGSYRGNAYDLVLMTCAGQSLPGGNATHRLVIFADRIS